MIRYCRCVMLLSTEVENWLLKIEMEFIIMLPCLMQLRRLQGRRNLGKEAMNIVDVFADDQLDPLSVLKNLTDETVIMSHSKKNKDQMPSVQKRKHQITWLAHKVGQVQGYISRSLLTIGFCVKSIK